MITFIGNGNVISLTINKKRQLAIHLAIVPSKVRWIIDVGTCIMSIVGSIDLWSSV